MEPNPEVSLRYTTLRHATNLTQQYKQEARSHAEAHKIGVR